MWTLSKKNKVRGQTVTIQTVNGKIPVARDMDYCWYCGKMQSQKDIALGIVATRHRMTGEFIEMLTFLGQTAASYEDAREILYKLKGIEVSASQIQTLTEEVGFAVYEADVRQAEEIFKKPEKYIDAVLERYRANDTLYILMDGSAVNTRIQDENGSTWKEMKLGMVFRGSDVIRRGTKLESHIITKKEYVTYFGEVGKFKELLFAAAVRAGYGSIKNTVVIGDGAHWIWNMCDECFPDAVRILDYYHMVENVYEYANVLFAGDEKKKTGWAKTVIQYIKSEQHDKAIRIVCKDTLKDNPVKTAVNLQVYLSNNRDRMNYRQYERNGYYIGSGMIEGGNKVVIQKRMKLCGMRWSVHGGQCVAALRAKSQSKKWDCVKAQIFPETVGMVA